MIISLILPLLLFEFVVFRFFLLPGSVPELIETNYSEVLHYQPNQTGTYRVKNEISSPYSINRSGWNSEQPEFSPSHLSGIPVIAIIGDSYVEAFQVPYHSSLAEQLNRRLEKKASVYRFGISGAPLSHYLYTYETLVSRLSPQLIIFVLIHNDFHESIVGAQSGLYTQSFAKWPLLDDGTLGPITEPRPYRKSLLSLIKKTNTYQFLVNRMRIDLTALKRRILDLIKPTDSSKPLFIANVNTGTLDSGLPFIVARKFFERLSVLTQRQNTKFLTLLDGPRSADPNACLELKRSPILDFNKRIVALATMHDIPIIDLSEAFLKAQCDEGLPLRFETDGHWTIEAHQSAAEEILAHSAMSYLRQNALAPIQ